MQLRLTSVDESTWRRVVVLAALAALAIRIAIVLADWGGSTDLDIYTYFGRFVAHGVSPYHVPALESAGGASADEPVLEFALYGGLLGIWDSPAVVRLFLALCDFGVVLVIGLLLPRTRSWRAGAILFLGFSPLPILAWTYIPEDKSLALLLLVLVVASAESGRHGRAWVATGALAALKWMGAFFALPLLVEGVRARGRVVLVPACAAAIAGVLATLPFFPDTLLGFERRSHRMLSPPMFDSITVLAARAHLYHTALVPVWLSLSFFTITAAHACYTIDIGEAIALSSAAAFVFLPDEPPDRILLVSVALMLVVRERWLLWSALSLVPALWLLIDHTVGPGHFLRSLIGSTGSTRHVLGANLLMLSVAATYLADRWMARGRAPIVPIDAKDSSDARTGLVRRGRVHHP